MIRITEHLAIDESEIQEHFIRSSGPGGQNVNKVSTAVQLRFDVANSPSLPEDIRHRLIKLAGPSRMTDEGELLIDARQHRTRQRNRDDALQRLIDLIRHAVVPPKKRRKTRPTLASRKRRLESKRQRSQTKKNRGSMRRDEV